MSFLFGSGGAKATQPQASAALTIQQSSYGTPVYLLYGTNRVYGNLLWYGAFTSTLVSTGGGGGKGGIVGGGGKGGGNSEYNYTASFAIALCEGPITSIGEVYVSKQVTTLATIGNALVFTGAQAQAVWPYLTTNFPTQALTYSELAYVGLQNFSLGTSSETPQFSFETFGLKIFGNGIQDASPDQIFIDFLGRCGLPSAYIDTFTSLASYCQASGFFISPLMDEQQMASEWLKEMMDTLNSEFVWLPSQGYLTAVSYGVSPVSGNGVNYVPNLNPIYTFGDDDYIRDDDEDPVKCTRSDLSDVYNQVPIEYVNKADQYNIETYQAFDDSLVDVYGFRTAPTLQAHHVTDPNVAQTMALNYMNRQIYTRNTFTLKLPWNYILLDPMDLVAINDTNLGLVNYLVRVVSIEEDEKDGTLQFTTEEVPGVSAQTLNPNFGVTRYLPNYNQSPGNINTPVIFEPPLALMQAATIDVNIGISSSNPLWGGCNIWISTDGVTYQLLDQFNSVSRMGVLTSSLATFTPAAGGNNVDTTHTLAISMVESNGSFNNAATENDAVVLNTLCYVDGEFICYGQDILTGTNAYNLTYLNRGCYGSTISAHASGANFVRMDAGVFSYTSNQFYVGQTLYFKFLSFNVWGAGLQGLDEVSPYTYTLKGTALLTPLANPTGVAVSYFGDIAQINWQPITDIRSPILYEIRKGAAFASAQIIGTVAQNTFPVFGTDTYWVTALYYTPTGTAVYSSSPPSVAVSTPALVDYVLGTYDEAATSWSGTVSGGAVVTDDTVQVSGSANILGVANVLTLPNFLQASASEGTYTAPSGHTISAETVVSAQVIMNWTLTAVSSTSDVTTIADIPTTADITGAVSSSLVFAQPQINLSQDGSSYAGWQNWVPGVYTFKSIQFQIVLYSLSLTVTAILTDLSFAVDLSQRIDTGTSNSSASADTTVDYPNGQFNEGPAVLITIQSAQAGDDVITTSIGASSFAYSVYNAGSRVVRTVTYSATGF